MKSTRRKPSPATHQSSPTTWLLVSDLDETLLGDDASLQEFLERRATIPNLRVVLNSSRPLKSVQRSLDDAPVPFQPDGIIAAMGTEILLNGRPDAGWTERFGTWDRSVVDSVMRELGAVPHAEEFQTPFKASFAVPAEMQDRARDLLHARELEALIITSGETDFDVLPPEAGKGAAIAHVLHTLDVGWDRLIVAGDSGNDLTMFEISEMGIVVGNARRELIDEVDPGRTYRAEKSHAAGVLEGLLHWTGQANTPMDSKA